MDVRLVVSAAPPVSSGRRSSRHSPAQVTRSYDSCGARCGAQTRSCGIPSAGALDATSLAGVDAVVNLSGANLDMRWTEKRKREIVDSRVETTGLLARATRRARAEAVRCFLVAGGVGIYGDRGDEILTEESELGSGFLADVGQAWEAAAEPAREAGIRDGELPPGRRRSRARVVRCARCSRRSSSGSAAASEAAGSGGAGSRSTTSSPAYRFALDSRARRARQSLVPRAGDERAVHEGARPRDRTADHLPAPRSRREDAVRRDGRGGAARRASARFPRGCSRPGSSSSTQSSTGR